MSWWGFELRCEALRWLGLLAQILRRSRFQLREQLVSAWHWICVVKMVEITLLTFCTTKSSVPLATVLGASFESSWYAAAMAAGHCAGEGHV